jgi:hypothetical protein
MAGKAVGSRVQESGLGASDPHEGAKSAKRGSQARSHSINDALNTVPDQRDVSVHEEVKATSREFEGGEPLGLMNGVANLRVVAEHHLEVSRKPYHPKAPARGAAMTAPSSTQPSGMGFS